MVLATSACRSHRFVTKSVKSYCDKLRRNSNYLVCFDLQTAYSFFEYSLVEWIYQECHLFRNYATKTSKLYHIYINITIVGLDRWRNTVVYCSVVVMIGLVNTDRISHQAISNLDNQTWIILAIFMIMIPHVHDQCEFQPRNLEGVFIPLIQKRLNF